jgi:peptidoglycan/xylan/chitin deacetylase (PgdA/CDA1 family)
MFAQNHASVSFRTSRAARRFLAIPALFVATVAASACSSSGAREGGQGAQGAQAETTGTTAQALTTYPEINFDPRPSYLSPKTLALTFDDGPDYTNTAQVLNVLKNYGVKATFFINTKNWSDVDSDASMQDLVRRMVNEGHQLGNHTVHHPHLAGLSAADIEAEISGVERTVKNIFGASAPPMTLFRAPYGEPYQGNDPNNPSASYSLVAPIVAKHAVEIGWALDEFDYNCPDGDGGCVFNNFTSAVSGGAYGVVLMHAVHSQTVAALPDIINYIRANGYTLVQVEDVVRARFGKSSAEIISGATSCTPSCGGRACGSDGCGGTCGTCGANQTCNASSQCVSSCTPSCSGKTCGDDGCGGTCGTCGSGQSCAGGSCQTSSGSCAGVTPWDPNKPWYNYATGELHTGSNNHLYACKNVAYCIDDPTGPVGGTYGWTDRGPC